MRASIATPPGFQRRSDAARRDSLRPAARAERARASATAIPRLYELFGSDRLAARREFGAVVRAADPKRMALGVVVRVQEGAHLLDELPCPAGLFHRRLVTGDPQLSGFAAHRVSVRERGRQDRYGCLEKDIVVEDPLFFRELAFFDRSFPARLAHPPLLRPSR